MRKILNLYILVAATIFFTSCKNNTTKSNNTLKINFQTEPMSLEPKLGINLTSQIAIRALFEGLMKISEKGEVTLGIAEKYMASEDKKTYVFKLRDTYWSDGEKVSAYDFERAWKNAIRPDSLCRLPHLFYSIKNAKKIRENLLSIDDLGVKAINDKTLKIELEYPAPFFLSLLSNPLFSPAKDIKPDDGKETLIISNGPFILREYRPNKEMILVKNPYYYLRDQIKIDAINISFIKDPQTAMNMFKKNEFDFIGDPVSKIPLEEEEKLLKLNKLTVKPAAGIYWIGFNTDKTPYCNVHFRRALAYSLDNELFSQLLNYKQPAKTFVPDFLSNLNEFSSWYDVSEAKKQLEIALTELNLTKDNMPIVKLTYCEKIDGGKQLPLLIKKQWEKNLNIKVEVQEMEWNSYLDALFKHKLDVVGIPWFSYINDASYLLETFKLRSLSSNWTLWENKEFIESLDNSNQCVDQDKRKEFLSNAEKVIESEMPIIPLFYDDYRYLTKPNVKNIVITKIGEIEFRYCSIN